MTVFISLPALEVSANANGLTGRVGQVAPDSQREPASCLWRLLAFQSLPLRPHGFSSVCHSIPLSLPLDGGDHT